MKKHLLAMLLAVMAVCTLVLAVPAMAAETEIELLYDDRKELSSLVDTTGEVTISNEVVTSYKVGTTTKDEHVLVYQNGTLYAVGTGTATLTVGDKSYTVHVKAAPISMFLITGHSVGAGQEGNGAQSVVVEAGQVYSSFQRTSLPTANGGLGYGADVRAGSTGTGALDAFAPGQGGTRGVGSAMAYRYNQLTGQKVWVMNLAIPGSCINEWLPGVAGWHYEKYKDDPAKEPTYLANYAYKYESVLQYFGNAQQIMKNEIAAGHYTLEHMAMFYFSGANFGNANYNDWTYDSLKSDYETMWNGLKKDLAMDMDGDGDTETLETMGIVPLWTASNTDYRQDKALNYIMAASGDYPDVFIASDVYRDWVTAAGLATFPAINYTTQSTAVTVPTSVSYSASTPNSLFCVADNTHLSQVTYNAVGLDMAQVYYNVTRGNNAVTGITLKFADNSAVPATVDVAAGVPSKVIVPVLTPEYGGNITVTASEGLEIVWPMAIKATKVGTGTVTFTAGGVTKTVTVNAADHQDHCVCGGHGKGLGTHNCSTVTWTAWGDDEAEKTALPTASGNYYLVCDLTNINAIGKVTDGSTINICLNGHDITMKGKRFYSVYGNFGLTDCQTEESWGTVSSSYSGTYGGLFYTYESNDELYLYAGNLDIDGTFVYGGLLYNTSGVVDIYKANLDGCTVARKAVSGQGTRNGQGGVICSAGGKVNIYGGKIFGGKTQNLGGNIYIGAGQLNISGGTISGGMADPSLGTLTDGAKAAGANIWVKTGATMNMSGGTITGGTITGADTTGGNIYMAGTFNLSGGLIKDGLCKTSNNSCGANLYLADYQANGEIVSVVNMTGGAFSGGRSEQGGGGSIQVHGLFYMYGGTITGGQAKNGGCVRVYRPGHFVLDGGTVTAGQLSHISDGNGGAAFMVEGNPTSASAGTKLATLTIKSGTVTGNTDTKTVNGGAIMVGTNGILNIEGGTINGGRGNNFVYSGKTYIGCGGTIYGYCTGTGTEAEINISGGTINGGLGESFGGLLAVKPASTGAIDINISGGTFNGGKAPLGAMMYLAGKNVDMDITGGTFTGGTAGEKGGLFWLGSGSDVTISGGTFTGGTAPVADGICVVGGKLTLDGTPTFNAQLYVENADSVVVADTFASTVGVDAPYVGKVATAATDKSACLTSETLSLTYNADDQGIYANGLLKAADGTTYATLAEGLASNNKVFTLLSNHVGGGEISGNVWLNLNSFIYTGDLSGEGTLYGYDTATDKYTTTDMGRIEGAVTCKVAPHFLGTTADIGSAKRYMAIADTTGYTFQRFDVKVTHMSINPEKESVGYKATVYGSDAVLTNIEKVGYTMQLGNYSPRSTEKAFDPAKKVVTLRVDNYGIENFGETDLSASACITLKDGTVVTSKTVTYTFRAMAEMVDASLNTLSNPRIAAMKALCNKYAAAMQGWDIPNITGWVDPRIPTPEQMEGIDPANIYYVGPTREYTSVTKLFMDLEDDDSEKIIFLDEGTYDIFREYRELGVTTPPDDVESPDYFPYCVFLPANTRLIGLGDVTLDFSPEADEITYGESRTWSPLNIIAPCYIENITVYCKNGRYAIHDDSHNAANDQGSQHIYKNVRAIYELSDLDAQGRRLGFNNTIGNGIAQGAEHLFEDCVFEFRGSNAYSAFYTHESGSKNPDYAPTLTFRRCQFLGGEGNTRTIRLQNLATIDLHILTLIEDCVIEGGIYLTIYKETSAQHFDVTVRRSGNPPVKIDKPEDNKYPVKFEE